MIISSSWAALGNNTNITPLLVADFVQWNEEPDVGVKCIDFICIFFSQFSH